MNNDKGIILVIVLAVSLMVMILAAAAIKMSELGYLAYGSEKRYQVANAAAETGVNAGVQYVVANSSCPGSGNCSGSLTTGGVSASYSCFSISAGNRCFIQGTGTFGGAKVVKNVVIPTGGGGTADYGALSLRAGGVVQLGGSAAIVSCLASCERPGLMYGGSAILQVGGSLTDDDLCPNNPKGIYGSPYAVLNKDNNHCTVSHGSISCPATTAMDDLIPKVFNSTDLTDLKSDLGGTYNGHAVDVSTLSVSGMPTAPAAPAPACMCTDTSLTLNSTTSTCNAGALIFATCGGQVKFNGTLTINGIPSTINTIVSPNSVTVTSVPSADGNFQGKSIYTTGSGKTITINDPDVKLNGSTLLASGGITLQSVGDITNGSVLAAGGDLTLQTVGRINDSAHSEYAKVSLISGGNITLQSGSGIDKTDIVATGTSSSITVQGSTAIINSTLVTAGTSGNVLLQSGSLDHSTLVTKGNLTVQGYNGMTESNVFANNTTLQMSNSDISGGILYSQGSTTTQGAGNGKMGTSGSPTLMLTGGALVLQHTGTPDFNGLFFANGAITFQSSGNFKVIGALIGNSTSSNTIQPGGNAQISFNPTVLTVLSDKLGGKMKAPNCSGGAAINRQPYISTTKMTVY